MVFKNLTDLQTGFLFSAILITLIITANITLGVSAGVTDDIVNQCKIDCSEVLGVTGSDLIFCEDNCVSGGELTLSAIGDVPFLGFFHNLNNKEVELFGLKLNKSILFIIILFFTGIGFNRLRQGRKLI